MRYADANRLLDPRPMPLEMGYQRDARGVLTVAVRTDMPRCSGAMFEWWFRSRPATREYRWWHPLDHISSEWIEGAPGTAVGAIHVVEERFTERPAEQLSIQFRDPAEAFDADALAAARAGGAVSGALLARGGAGHTPHRTADGAVIGSRLIHLCRDTDWGMVLRTRFFLGHDLAELGVPAAELVRIFPDAQGPNLLQHCYDEFSFLARLLPSLYLAEGLPAGAVRRPW